MFHYKLWVYKAQLYPWWQNIEIIEFCPRCNIFRFGSTTCYKISIKYRSLVHDQRLAHSTISQMAARNHGQFSQMPCPSGSTWSSGGRCARHAACRTPRKGLGSLFGPAQSRACRLQQGVRGMRKPINPSLQEYNVLHDVGIRSHQTNTKRIQNIKKCSWFKKHVNKSCKID